MGTCHVLVTPELHDRLKGDLGASNGVHIFEASDYGDGRLFLRIGSSRHFTGGYHGMQALIVEGDAIRFKAEGVHHEDS